MTKRQRERAVRILNNTLQTCLNNCRYWKKSCYDSYFFAQAFNQETQDIDVIIAMARAAGFQVVEGAVADNDNS